MTPVRVLYLNPFSQAVSGPDESLLTLLQALIRSGVEAHVALPLPGPHVARYERLGANVHFLPLAPLRRRPGPAGLALLVPRLLRATLAVASLARRERIDVIHTNMEVLLEGGLAAALLRLRHVQHYRGNTLDRPKPVFDLLTRLWSGTSHRVFCISRSTAAIFLARGLSRNVEVLYNPVDIDRYARAPRLDDVRTALGAGPADALVGTIGRIHPRKDVLTFLRAGAALVDADRRVRLAVIGAAEAPEEVAYRERLLVEANRLGISARVTWAGARSDVPEVMKALDLLLVTSRHEGFGRVVAEALSAGLPLVATDEGAFPELLEGVQGTRLAPAEAADGFARAARELLASGARPPGTAAERFDPDVIAGRVLGAYLG